MAALRGGHPHSAEQAAQQDGLGCRTQGFSVVAWGSADWAFGFSRQGWAAANQCGLSAPAKHAGLGLADSSSGDKQAGGSRPPSTL